MRQIFLLLLGLAWMSPATLQAQGPSGTELRFLQSALEEWFRSHNPAPNLYRVEKAQQDPLYNPNRGLVLPTPTYRSGRSTFFRMDGQPSGSAIVVQPDGQPAQVLRPGTTVGIGRIDAPKPASAPQAPSVDLAEEVEALLKGFLENYGDLAPGLQPEEEIMLVYGQDPKRMGQSQVYVINGQATTSSIAPEMPLALSARVSLRTLRDYRQGRIDQEALYQQIETERKENQPPSDPAYRIMSNILKEKMSAMSAVFYEGLFEGEPEIKGRNLWSRAYQVSVNFQRIDGYGVVYRHEFRPHFRPAPKPCDCPEDEAREAAMQKRWDQAVDDHYERIEAELPQVMVQYGRTLWALSEKDWLVVKVTLPGCEECEAPAAMDLQVSQQVLRRYDRGEMTLDEAEAAVEITERGKATETRLPRLRFRPNADFDFDMTPFDVEIDWNNREEEEDEKE